MMGDFEIIACDLSACFLALANALEAKGVLSKSELAAAAQERYLVLQERWPPEDIERLAILGGLSTQFEGLPGD